VCPWSLSYEPSPDQWQANNRLDPTAVLAAGQPKRSMRPKRKRDGTPETRWLNAAELDRGPGRTQL